MLSTLLLAAFRLRQQITPDGLYFLYVQVWLLVAFGVRFSLAMANRHTPALHARYMVCAALTLIDPIVARLIYTYSGVEPPHMQVATYLLIDVAAQLPTFFVHDLPAWRSFVRWIAGLPLP